MWAHSAESREKFVNDFLDNMTSVGLDHSAWFLLRGRIINWLKTSPSLLSQLGMNKETVLKHISSSKKLQDLVTVVLTIEQSKEFLRQLFFFERYAADEKHFYQGMANELLLPLNHFDPQREVYYPVTTITKNNAVGKYINIMRWMQAERGQGLMHCGALFSQAVQESKDAYSISLNPQLVAQFFQKIASGELPSIDKQVELLASLKPNKEFDIRLTSLTAEEAQKIKKFWFPGIGKLDKKADPAVLNFLIKQIHVMNVSQHGRFMFDHYPKKSDEAVKVLHEFKQNKLIADYHRYRTACLLIKNKTVQQNLLKLLDQVLVVAAKESTLGLGGHQSYYPNTMRLINKIGDELILKVQQGYKPDFDQIKKWPDLQAIQKSYSGLWRWIRSWLFNANAQQLRPLEDQDLSSIISDIREAVTLDKNFSKVINKSDGAIVAEPVELVYTAKKDSGATFGQQCHVLSEDKVKTTYMVKQGKDLGETLAEQLASLELREYGFRNRCTSSSAVTQLWFEVSSDSQDVKELDRIIFVASQYYDCDYTATASRVGGYSVRPTAAKSKQLPLFQILIELNKKCTLGLEDVVHAAARMGDFDLHSENVLLLFDLKAVTAADRPYVEQLVKEFEAAVAVRANSTSGVSKFFRYGQQDYVQLLANKIEEIKKKGGVVFFQKIDHGNSYYNDNSVTRLDQHITLPFRFLAGGGLALAPTNHAAEFIAAGQDEIILTDASCKILLENSFEAQKKDIDIAIGHLFKELHVIAQQKYSDSAKQVEAELHLLNALHKHLTNGTPCLVTDKADPVKQLKTKIYDLVLAGRERRVQQHEQEYLARLNNKETLSPIQKELKAELTRRVGPVQLRAA